MTKKLLPEDLDLVDDPHYQLKLQLADQSRLTVHIFNRREIRWIFSYLYREYPEGQTRGQPDLVNELGLVVDYAAGVVCTCDLSMHIIFPSRLGKVILYGMDVSPGAKTFLQFHYELTAPPCQEEAFFFQLAELQIGASRVIDLRPRPDAGAKAMIKPVEFPFPVKDRVEAEGGGEFRVPFFDNERQTRHFAFPRSILNK